MSIKVTQHSFAGGQLDRTLLGGRQDLQKYFTGASELTNYIVQRQGCLTKRPGTDDCFNATERLRYYDGDTLIETTSTLRFVPFIFESEYGYAILFTPGRITVYAMDGTTPQEIDNSPYYSTIADLGVCQSGDVLFIASKYHVPHRLFRSSEGVFTLEPLAFANTLPVPGITSLTITGATTGTPDRTIAYCVTAVYATGESLPSSAAEVTYKSPWASTQVITVLITAAATTPLYYNVYKKAQNYFGLIGSTMASATKISAAASSCVVTEKQTDATSYQLFYTPIYDTDAECTALLSATEMNKWGWKKGAVVLLSGDLEINITTPVAFNKIRLGLGYACSRRYLYYKNYYPRAYWKTTLYGTKARKHSVVVTYDDNTTDTISSALFDQISGGLSFIEFDHSGFENRDAPLPAGELTAFNSLQTGGHKEYVDITKSANPTKKAKKLVIKGWTDNDMTTACTGDIGLTVTNMDQWNEWKKYDVTYSGNPMVISGVELYAVGGAVLTFTDDYITPNIAVGVPKQTELFKADGELPGLVTLYQQRLMFASSIINPSKYWLSRPGNFLDFSTSEIITESDPIIASLPLTKGPRISHIIAQRDVHCFCESSEWLVRAVSGNTLSYKTVTAEMQSAAGCAEWLPPVLCGTSLLFVEKSGRSVREYKYDYAADGFAGRDISVVSASLFEGRQIVDWAYQQHPDSILWCVMSDGMLLGFTYMPEHEVYAWFQADMEDAIILAVCGTEALIGYDDKLATSEIFLLVKRGTSYHIERMRPRPTGETLLSRALHLDCMSTYTAGAAQTVPEGFVAIAKATGAVSATPTEGDVYIQGVPITAELTTVHPEIPGNGTIQNTIKAVVSANLRVQDSEGLNMRLAWQAEAKKQDVRECEEIITAAVAPETEATVVLAQGDFEVIPEQANSTDGRITIVDDGLFGSTILSVSTNLSIQPTDGMEG